MSILPENLDKWEDDEQLRQAAQCFQQSQAHIISCFEGLEDSLTDEARAACQAQISDAKIPQEAGRFVRTAWERTNHDATPGGGGTMAMLRGRTIEKAGVHFSAVYGLLGGEAAKRVSGAEKDGGRFFATGVSVIIHPWNPHCPTIHMNTRYVATSRRWFGGGGDMTPVLMRRRSKEHPDSQVFLQSMERCFDEVGMGANYEDYARQCDEYFYLKHRQEPRGIGGSFYDDLPGETAEDFARYLALSSGLAKHFCASTGAIIAKNMLEPFSPADRQEQRERRGRYVEFNLLYDRGTLFGLQTGGNVTSILSSMPPSVIWP